YPRIRHHLTTNPIAYKGLVHPNRSFSLARIAQSRPRFNHELVAGVVLRDRRKKNPRSSNFQCRHHKRRAAPTDLEFHKPIDDLNKPTAVLKA
ncbi:hypothetical protein MJO29_006442, partial [Puccinia striiformis f. sp. tritici]